MRGYGNLLIAVVITCYVNYLNCDKCATISLYMTKFVIAISVLKISRIGYQSVL